MKIEIVVVAHQGELWFEAEGLKFDTLNASWELGEKEMHLIRNGAQIATTNVRQSRGEAIFYDYCDNADAQLFGSDLRPESFESNDRLLLDVPDEFCLAKHLKETCGFLESFTGTIPVGQQMSLDEIKDILIPELDRTQQARTTSQVLRFRRGK